MSIVFDPLWHLLLDRKLNKQVLKKELGFASATVTKLSKGENVESSVIDRLCRHFDVPVEQICKYQKDDKAAAPEPE